DTVPGLAWPRGYVRALTLPTAVGGVGRAAAGGRYALQVRASSGHTLEVWQMTAADGGQHTTVLVPAR
ncbi:MAG: hypothetical protein ACK5U8_10585, partial [Deltaproteobacteria bacterium]